MKLGSEKQPREEFCTGQKSSPARWLAQRIALPAPCMQAVKAGTAGSLEPAENANRADGNNDMWGYSPSSTFQISEGPHCFSTVLAKLLLVSA